MKRTFVILIVLAVTLCLAPQLWAKTFYLKNGEEIEYQRYWQKGERIYLQVNRDIVLDFAREEVDLDKPPKAAAAKKQGVHKKLGKEVKPSRHRATGNSSGGTKSRQPKALAAKPVPVAAPAKATPANTPHAPEIQKELDAVYARFYAAIRSGDYNEQKKYVAGQQRATVEYLEKSPAPVKAMVKKMMATMDKSYAVTSCFVASDGKSATLNIRRKVTGTDVSGVVDFVKVGNEWKIALVKE